MELTQNPTRSYTGLITGPKFPWEIAYGDEQDRQLDCPAQPKTPVDDAFWGYADLPDVSTAQKRFEDDLRASTGGKVSLYKPGSPYRDSVTPSLCEANLHVFEDATAAPDSQPVQSNQRSVSAATPVPRPVATRTASVPARSGTFSGYSHWWSALSAVPASHGELDWWAASDGRASRYERLRRVWFDTTRNFWFYRPDQEDHLTATLWENLTLFHPSISVPALFRAAGLEPPAGVTDACWSYEFEERVDGHLKQIDVTLHFRDKSGDALLVVEAKRPGGSLKPTDLNPCYYLDLPSFEFTPRKYMLYLLDDADLAGVQSAVKSANGTKPGFLSWQQLGQLQATLVSSLPVPDNVQRLTAALILWQFRRHGFLVPDSNYPTDEASLGELIHANQRLLTSPSSDDPGKPLADRAAAQIRLVQSLNIPPHVRNFLAGAMQHQSCTCGVVPTQLAWNYLFEEPAQADIIPGMAGRQRTADRRKPLWRMPTQSDAV